jgi:hypothetical protein
MDKGCGVKSFQTTQKKCSACGAEFGCGNTESDGGCWCNNFPAIFQLDSMVDCLCPACLKEAAIKKINEYVATITPEEALNNKAKDLPRTNNQIEGIDFYVENGKYIFTAWHHLKRGDCCGNGCRHCPY